VFVSIDPRRPIYRQIYDAVRERVMSGELRPGTRLPSTRALAAELGVSRRTTLVAYEQLLAEGYVIGRVGSGTTVTSGLTAVGHRLASSRTALKPRAQWPPRLSTFGQRLAHRYHPNAGPRGAQLYAMTSVTRYQRSMTFRGCIGAVSPPVASARLRSAS
jgi:DNA-binding transcriptional regulator YhcF (GntR family)